MHQTMTFVEVWWNGIHGSFANCWSLSPWEFESPYLHFYSLATPTANSVTREQQIASNVTLVSSSATFRPQQPA